MFVDSHCHLNFPELRSQLPDILKAMSEAQVGRALCIGTTLEEFEQVHELALAHANLWATVGVHPDNEGVREPSLDDLLQRAALPRVVGIGETGLDYYRLGERTVADMAWQRERFRVHIRAARQTDLPLVIHTRSASEDTLSILREEGVFCPKRTRIPVCPRPVGYFIASPKPPKWPAPRWPWTFTSRFRAFSPSATPPTCARWPAKCRWSVV